MLNYTISIQTKLDAEAHMLTPYFWALVPAATSEKCEPIEHCGWAETLDLAYRAAIAKLKDLEARSITTVELNNAFQEGRNVGRVEGARRVLEVVCRLMHGESLPSVQRATDLEAMDCSTLVDLYTLLNSGACQREEDPNG